MSDPFKMDWNREPDPNWIDVDTSALLKQMREQPRQPADLTPALIDYCPDCHRGWWPKDQVTICPYDGNVTKRKLAGVRA